MVISISVIIPAYRQASYLGEAIESALRQTISPREVIVVDDGSPDNTKEICDHFGARIKYLPKDNAGVSAARNTGILASLGQWIQFLDADDVLPSDTFEKHASTLRLHGTAKVAYCGSYLLGVGGERLSEDTTYYLPELPCETFYQLLLGNNFPPHAAIVHRSALENAGLWDPMIDYYEDWDLWLRLAFTGATFTRTPNLYVGYRHHPGSATKNIGRMRQGAMQVLTKTQIYAPKTRAAARGLSHGRWNVRRHFLHQLATLRVLTQKGGKELVGDDQITKGNILQSAILNDPLLLLTSLRDLARNTFRKKIRTG